jgi:hypothetical protein
MDTIRRDFSCDRECTVILLRRYTAIFLIYYGISGGRIGGCGIEGGADRMVRNGSKDGLAVSIAFKTTACSFLYTVKVISSPAILC